jgi:hypothetical protein
VRWPIRVLLAQLISTGVIVPPGPRRPHGDAEQRHELADAARWVAGGS